VDIIITYDLLGRRTKKIHIGETKLNVLAINDLIEMNLKAAREQDIADVQALRKLKK